MQATNQATIWGIQAGIDTGVLQRRPSRRYSFYRLASYEQTDNLLAIQGVQAHEDHVNGHLIMVFSIQGRCVGLWYNGARMGTVCLDYQGSDLDYAMEDPFYPWHD